MNKQTIIAAVAALAMVGTIPAASATFDDGVTRTFDAIVGAQLDFKNGGTGIYDFPANTEACPNSILGLRAVVPDVYYYQHARVDFNLKAGKEFIPSPVAPISLTQPCPIPGSSSLDNAFLVIEDMNLWGPYNAVSADQLLCGQQDFLDCFPDPRTATLTVANCHYSEAVFDKVSPHDGKGGLTGSTLGSLGFLSRSISCPVDLNGDGATWRHSTDYYTLGTVHCPDFFFDVGIWGTSFCLIKNNNIVPYDDGSSYLTTCASVTYLAIDATTGQSFSHDAVSHDYKLILDLGEPSDWDAALGVHTDDSLQGWHDLGGKNGFPCPAGTPIDDKKDTDIASQTATLQAALENDLP